MPWNEPGKDKDPWGQRSNDGPPDLDEVFKNLKNKFGGLLGGGGKGKIPRVPGGSSNLSGFIGFIVVALLIVWALTGIYIVDEGWRGVETRFGERTVVTQAGPHWHFPYPIEDVELINVADIRTARKNSKMLTSDENIVVMSIEIQYNVKDAQDFAFEVFDPDLTLQQTAETAIREVVGNNDMDLIITEGRAVVGSATKEIMQSILDEYRTGINVVQVNMDEAQPPEEVQDAFEDAIKAREDEQRIINEANAYRNDVVPKARGEGQGLLEQAEAYKTRVIKSAEGEASRFNQLLAEYQRAPEVTRERLYIDAIESVLARSPKVMVDVEGGNNLMFLPLDQLMGRASAGVNPLSGRGGSSTSPQTLIDELKRNTSRSRDRETR
ncbi:MAG: FtsH protease activity modulator HflK [Gammaproteobacteria bacterium]|nr:MAG: FtsH protease activity modulator HflK [Gammaproteobacteria bacterium]